MCGAWLRCVIWICVDWYRIVSQWLTQLVEGSFVTDLESVEGIFQVAVEFFFVVFVGDDVRLFFGGG